MIISLASITFPLYGKTPSSADAGKDVFNSFSIPLVDME